MSAATIGPGRSRSLASKLVLALAVLAATADRCQAYFADWSMLTRDRLPTCVPIPANMTLCHKIGYNKMRLPNLLEHDTVQEASQQASSWVPLLNIKCHEDTQLFLCSLFAPVCLDRPIYPCRSLCLKVKAGCKGTMESYGYPWPPMLDCGRFPMDNDMCITSQSTTSGGGNPVSSTSGGATSGAASSNVHPEDSFVGGTLSFDPKSTEVEESGGGRLVPVQPASGPSSGSPRPTKGGPPHQCASRTCNQRGTYDNILAGFCSSDFVVKMKLREVEGRTLRGRKVNTVFKTWRGTPEELNALRKPTFVLDEPDECCSTRIDRSLDQRFLVMGRKVGANLVPTMILPWKKSKDMKRARRMFKQVDCSDFGGGDPTRQRGQRLREAQDLYDSYEDDPQSPDEDHTAAIGAGRGAAGNSDAGAKTKSLNMSRRERRRLQKQRRDKVRKSKKRNEKKTTPRDHHPLSNGSRSSGSGFHPEKPYPDPAKHRALEYE